MPKEEEPILEKPSRFNAPFLREIAEASRNPDRKAGIGTRWGREIAVYLGEVIRFYRAELKRQGSEPGAWIKVHGIEVRVQLSQNKQRIPFLQFKYQGEEVTVHGVCPSLDSTPTVLSLGGVEGDREWSIDLDGRGRVTMHYYRGIDRGRVADSATAITRSITYLEKNQPEERVE